jgi:hypothetical protein
MWSQAAVRIAKEDRNIVRCIVKYHDIGGSIAIHIPSFKIIADPKIFQNARTGLRSYRLKRSIAITQSSRDRIRAEGILLQYHPQIEQTVVIKIGHFELVRRGSTHDRRSKRQVSVARKHTHTR